jgi:hypothetical protein
MASLPITECPECGRDVAVTRRGLVYRHDPASGRDPELKSCKGSLKPVQAPAGALLLFVATDAPEEADDVPEAAPAEASLLF